MQATRLAALGVLFLAACDGGAPSPKTSAGASATATTASAMPLTSTSATASAASLPSQTPAVSASASASARPAELDLSQSPKLMGEDGTPLQQTKDRPSVDSAAFKKRLELLWKAIVTNDAAVAADVFFPVVAYEQVKDIQKPKADWKHRLMKNFDRDVREYHKKLGPNAASMVLAGLDLDESRVKWMDRGKEGNKVGYWRVTRSKLRYTDGKGGPEKTLELTSLISWRGEWFVVHLHGFK